MIDSDVETAETLEDLEKRIAEMYGRTADELTEKLNDYLKKFAKKDYKMREQVEAGEITPEDYQEWRLEQLARGQDYEAMRDAAAQVCVDADKVAAAYINEETPNLFALNHNYEAYRLERDTGMNLNFTMYDKETVKRLVEQMPDLLPPRKIDIPADIAWNRRNITEEVTQGILQGESIPKIAGRMRNVTDMGKVAATRNARTAVTGAQNAGRIESYNHASKMGVDLKKRWMATLDGRTRHSHAMLDGQVVDNDETFSNGCRYPGDPSAPAAEIYNCRCTLIAEVEGVERVEPPTRIARDLDGSNYYIQNMTYAEWVESKKG